MMGISLRKASGFGRQAIYCDILSFWLINVRLPMIAGWHESAPS